MRKRSFLILMFIVIALVASYLYAEDMLLDLENFKSLSYRVSYENQSFYYLISIDKEANGYEVTTSTKFFVPKGSGLTMDDVIQSTYAGIMMNFFNPAYEQFLKFINIQNPGTLEMYGVKIEYGGRVRVGKYFGEKFTFITEGSPQIVWVISKDLKMILKVEIPPSNMSMELVDFKKR